MGGISFIGNPPYTLPAVQRVEAKAVDAAVEMTLRVIVPDPRPDIDLSDRPEPTSVHLHVHLPLAAAQHLLGQLQEAIRSQKRKRGRKVIHCGVISVATRPFLQQSSSSAQFAELLHSELTALSLFSTVGTRRLQTGNGAASP